MKKQRWRFTTKRAKKKSLKDFYERMNKLFEEWDKNAMSSMF